MTKTNAGLTAAVAAGAKTPAIPGPRAGTEDETVHSQAMERTPPDPAPGTKESAGAKAGKTGPENRAHTQGFKPGNVIWIRSANTMRARGRKSRIKEAGHVTAPGRRLTAWLRFPVALGGRVAGAPVLPAGHEGAGRAGRDPRSWQVAVAMGQQSASGASRRPLPWPSAPKSAFG